MFKKYQQPPFRGIGASDERIAEVLVNLGYRVSRVRPEAGRGGGEAERLGAKVFPRPRAQPRPRRARRRVLVAVARDNVEGQVARSRGVPVIPRAEMLAELMRLKYGIAIAAPTARPPRLHGAAVAGAGRARPRPWWSRPPCTASARTRASGRRVSRGRGGRIDGSFLKLTPTISVRRRRSTPAPRPLCRLDRDPRRLSRLVNKVPSTARRALLDQPNIQQMIHPDSRSAWSRTASNRVARSDRAPARLLRHAVAVRDSARGKTLGPATIQCGPAQRAQRLAAVGVGLNLGVPFERIQQALAGFAASSAASRSRKRGRPRLDDYGPSLPPRSAPPWRRQAGFDRRVVTVFQPTATRAPSPAARSFLTAFYQSDG